MQQKRRVAVLGGGMGALAAVYALTGPDNPDRDRLEVTVYQLGWRLGGKGASGRNLREGTRGRIEEHGLHNLFGFYENTFRMMSACYAELDRPPGSPLATFREAVSPESAAVFLEPQPDGTARPWRILNPVNGHFPGEGELALPLWDALVMAVSFVDLNVLRPPEHPPHPQDGQSHPRASLLPVVTAIYAAAQGLLGGRAALARLPGGAGRPLKALGWRGLRRAAMVALRLGRAAMWRTLRGRIAADDALRRQWVLLNFASSILIGMLEDDVFHRGFDAINDHDFRAWLAPRALADGGVMMDSVLMRVVYDSSFAYVDGDTSVDDEGRALHANYEAGTLLRGLVRSSLLYKGAFGWKLQGGCGDVLIAPLYEVLRRRGVRFRFFHAVESLGCGADPKAPISSVTLRVQTPVWGGADAYEPLVDFGGVPCWPSEPLWDQLVHGEALRAAGVNLESPEATAPGAKPLVLRRGVDFDEVLLGIAAGALPHLCRELVAVSPRWAAMTRHLKTTPTQALQVWSSADSRALGLQAGGAQPITGFWYSEASPLNVWADMSHLLPWEGRSAEDVQHVSYFVSPMRDAGGEEASLAATHAAAKALLSEHVGSLLWPDARTPRGALDWSLLDAPAALTGPDRLAGQYLRANVSPSERYVLSVAGSTQHRLPSNLPETFPNLYLAGDWTRNGLNCGCMEAAVTSGLLAGEALGNLTLEMVRYA